MVIPLDSPRPHALFGHTLQTLTSAGGRTPTHAPAWNKRPATPPTAPIPASSSYDDDSMRQGSVVSSLPPQSLNRNQASLAYENQLRPIGEDQSASRGEYSPGESGGTRDGESFREGGRQNGHRSEEEEEEARGMVQFPTGLGVGDYNNLSMMVSLLIRYCANFLGLEMGLEGQLSVSESFRVELYVPLHNSDHGRL